MQNITIKLMKRYHHHHYHNLRFIIRHYGSNGSSKKFKFGGESTAQSDLIQFGKKENQKKDVGENGGGGGGPTLSSYLLLIIPGISFGLGVWQFRRKGWKEELIRQLELKTKGEPIDLPHTREEFENREYHRVRVDGTFDYSQEMLIGPRSLILSDGDTKAGAFLTTDNETGFYVVTPFKLSESGQRILINRGWVPARNVSNSIIVANGGKLPDLGGHIKDKVSISGLIRLTEEPTVFLSKTLDRSSCKWGFRNIDALAQKLDTLPIFLDADSSLKDLMTDSGPIPGQTRVQLRNEHMQYLITWFSLSALTTFLWFKKFVY